MDINYDVIPFFQDKFVLKKPGAANFADVIKIVAIIIKTAFKDPKKIERTRNYVLTCGL